MSLPSRPSPRPGGLPSMPRSSDRGGSNTPSSRSVRPQRSAAQIPSSRARPSRDDYDDMPPAPRSSGRSRSTARSDERSQRTYSRERGGGTSGRDRDRDYDRPPLPSSSQRASGSSTTSSNTSSGGSSFLDRMRVRSNDTTPRTSIDDDGKRERDYPSRDRRRRRSEEEEEYEDDRDYDDKGRNRRQSVAAQAAAEGDGSWLWKSVTSAASSLTVNINKAWASKMSGEDGEETPAGEESRLTRAMKAYHLAHAQRPSDLPDWLFSAAERNAGRERGGRRDDDRDREHDRGRRSDDNYDEEPAPRSRGLRDIYDNAAKEAARPSASANRRTPAATSSAADDGGQSKATNRLKAIRDAKRAAAGVRDEPPMQQAVEDREYARERETPSAPAPRARVGLPTGPGRARRI